MEKMNESGRSMVEMLGVLAIVGVLSVGGLAGYTTAMAKYRATEIMNSISLTLVEAETQGKTVNYVDQYQDIPASIKTVIENIYVDPASRQVALKVPTSGNIACNKTTQPCKTVSESITGSQSFRGYKIGVVSSAQGTSISLTGGSLLADNSQSTS